MDRLDKNNQTTTDLFYSKLNTIIGQIDSENTQFNSEIKSKLDTGISSGGVVIKNGLFIPAGSTGKNSYFAIIPVTYNDAINNSEIGQLINWSITIAITDYVNLSSPQFSYAMQKYSNGIYINASVFTPIVSDVINGTTLIRTFTYIYTITQADITNKNSYVPIFFVNNTIVSAANCYLNVIKFNLNKTKRGSDLLKTTNNYVSNIRNTLIILRNGTVGVDCDFSGNTAIQDAINSITDASISNVYDIIIDGVFVAASTSDYTNTIGLLKSFINGKNFINLIGKSKETAQIIGFLPDNLGSGFAYMNYQTVIWNCFSNISDITITCQNQRYPIHIDGGISGCKDFMQKIHRCTIEHKGNSNNATNFTSYHPVGIGTSDGQVVKVYDSNIIGIDWCGYVHNDAYFNRPSQIRYINCNLISKNGISGKSCIITNTGSGVNDVFSIENCNLSKGAIEITDSPWLPITLSQQKADHIDYSILLHNVNPRAVINNGLRGYGLKISSKTTGLTSTVRFDQTSSAFSYIIGNTNESYEITNKYNRKQIFGYQYQDGGTSINGYAIGSLDIGMYGIGISSNNYIGALGKRLGDCSTVNKILTVIIDGVSYNIVFNKNYNNTGRTSLPVFTNTQIIAEIVSVIGGVATVSEYSVGRDYFPSFNNVETCINADATDILSGMGVVFTDLKTIRKALNSDLKIDGIAIDDCVTGGLCRIITKGEIFTKNTNYRFSTNETTSIQRNIGDKLGISAAAGIFELNATPSLLKCTRTNVLEII